MSVIRRLTVIAGALALAGSTVVGAEQVHGRHGKPVTAHEYKFPSTGSYKEVVKMDKDTGKCEQRDYTYNTPVGPFGEELSIHCRGPFELASLAVYMPGNKCSDSQLAKRDVPAAHHHHRRHGHQHLHKAHNAHKREVGAMVTATINGVVKTWRNEYSGGAPTPAPDAGSENNVASASSSAPASAPSSTASPVPCTPGATGGFARVAHYNAANKTAHGLVFLNNKGGQKSGVFDYKFGNSLSYASSDVQSGAASPQILDSGLTLPSNTELIIYSDKKCSDNDCGFFRPGTVAYHGFGGPEKVFVFEFKMPDDGKTAGSIDNANMPALWFLNAKIPRTGQYVTDPSCSCWKSGGGELDVVEVIDPGSRRCVTHARFGGESGKDDHIVRPVDKFMKLAVVFTNGAAHIKVLNDNTDYPLSLSPDDIKKWF